MNKEKECKKCANLFEADKSLNKCECNDVVVPTK